MLMYSKRVNILVFIQFFKATFGNVNKGDKGILQLKGLRT